MAKLARGQPEAKSYPRALVSRPAANGVRIGVGVQNVDLVLRVAQAAAGMRTEMGTRTRSRSSFGRCT